MITKSATLNMQNRWMYILRPPYLGLHSLRVRRALQNPPPAQHHARSGHRDSSHAAES